MKLRGIEMKRICSLCGQMSADGNLWCEQIDCPAGQIPVVLGYGEFLGDIKILRLMRLFRTAAVYEAERDEKLILLKVAHAGHEEALKQESLLLARLAGARQANLPRLLPAYKQGNIKAHSYGKAVFRDETKYYEVFEHIVGEFLRDRLLQNPQPWYQHAAWIALGVCRALSYLYKHDGGLNLNISPDVIVVAEDKAGTPIPVLLDLGLIIKPGSVDAEVRDRAYHHILPSYMPPEIMEPGARLTEASDVYGVGLLLFEMFTGFPAYLYRLKSDDDVRKELSRNPVPTIDRRDIPQANNVQAILAQATHRNPSSRQPSILDLGKQLTTTFGDIPVMKSSRFERLKSWSMPAAIVGIVGVGFYLLIAAVFGS